MSTKQTKGKQTKGKKKFEMKKIESYEDRMITFAKRRSGIYKKMGELITMCNMETAFLVFSQSGKPYTFAHPSMEEVADRLNNPNSRHEQAAKKDNTDMLVKSYKKKKMGELMKHYEELLDELETKKVKEGMVKESRDEKEFEKMWWNTPLERLSVEELKQRHQVFMELHEILCNVAISRLEKEEDGCSSSCCSVHEQT